MRKPNECVWAAVDVATEDEARQLVRKLADAGITQFKIGFELITAIGGPAAVKIVKDIPGAGIFYDGKFGDIPNTVGGAAKAVSKHGVDIFNIHATAGPAAMQEAVKNRGSSKVLAVTLLTSLSYSDMLQMGLIESVHTEKQGEYLRCIITKLGHLAYEMGMNGLICSPEELDLFSDLPLDFMRVNPGIRPLWAPTNDQKRFTTPMRAICDGASAIVVGRPITNPPAPKSMAEAVELVFREVGTALLAREAQLKP